MATIGLIAAMPEEVKPLLARVGHIRRETSGGLTIYRFRCGERDACLVESGMGPQHAAVATNTLIDAAKPDLIISFGMAGAVTPGLGVGDLVIAQRLLFAKERLFSEQQGLSTDLAKTAIELLQRKMAGLSFSICGGTCITVGAILAKGETARLLPAGVINPVLEMETAAVAKVAARQKIPLLAVRAISDDASEDLGFNITDFTDRNMNIRVHRVLWAVTRRPWLIPQLLRLARSSRRAGVNLADAVVSLMEGL
jgi:adenosylhomocysteine nucleosidase